MTGSSRTSDDRWQPRQDTAAQPLGPRVAGQIAVRAVPMLLRTGNDLGRSVGIGGQVTKVIGELAPGLQRHGASAGAAAHAGHATHVQTLVLPGVQLALQQRILHRFKQGQAFGGQFARCARWAAGGADNDFGSGHRFEWVR